MTSKRPGTSSASEVEFLVRETGERLDQLIAREVQAQAEKSGSTAPSRSQIVQWIAAGEVLVDDKEVRKAGHKPKAGSRIRFTLPAPREMQLSADKDVAISVVHEEEAFLVINKPPGLVVHPGAGRGTSTLVHGLLHHLGEGLQQIGGALRPGLVHRLDKDTSGLLVIAKSEIAFRSFVKQLRPPRTMERRYLLIARNLPRSGKNSRVAKDGLSGEICHRIGRSPANRTRMAAVSGDSGKEAFTAWRLREHLELGVLCEARLETGRTHQIRVHFQATKAPLLGDPVYGAKGLKLPAEAENALARLGRQALHAWRLSFLHPLSGTALSFEAPLPADMEALLLALRRRD